MEGLLTGWLDGGMEGLLAGWRDREGLLAGWRDGWRYRGIDGYC